MQWDPLGYLAITCITHTHICIHIYIYKYIRIYIDTYAHDYLKLVGDWNPGPRQLPIVLQPRLRSSPGPPSSILAPSTPRFSCCVLLLRWILKILHDPKYPILWELWYYNRLRSCRIFSINSIICPNVHSLPQTLNPEP